MVHAQWAHNAASALGTGSLIAACPIWYGIVWRSPFAHA